MAEAGNIQLNGDGTGAKNIPNPAIVHKDVIEMFPELDLTQILGEYGHMTSEGLASMVIDKMEQIPKKRGTKRKSTCNGNFEADLSLNSTVYDDLLESNSSDEDEAALAVGDLLIDKMLAELLHTLKAELRNQSHIDIDRSNISYMKTFLLDHFLGVRSEFVLRILPHFQMHLVPTAIACFFSENNFGVKLHTAAPSLPQHFWLKSAAPLLLRRTKKSGAYYGNNSEDFRREYQRYAKIMESLQQGEYAALLTTDLKLTKQCNLIKWVRTQPEERIECLVCFDQFTINRMVFCNAPTMPQGSFFADDYSMLSVDDHVFEIEDADQPGPSSRMYEKKPRLFHQPQPELSAAGHKETDKNVPNNNLVIPVSNEDQKVSTHAFCRGCVRGAAQAATEQQPLADGGVGLRCMVPDCNNPILYSEIRTLLKREVRVKLDERILEENIGMASIQNLERCKRCNFAVQLEVDKNVDKVFDCINCGAKFCRLCEREWDDDHFGVSCEELDRKTQRDKKDRDLEKKLNEAVIRKCPRCGIAFMKDAGCNKMTCRCGMTQCYLCRESAIDYTHFCQHLRDPKMPNWKCGECKKSCLLYEDAVKKDELMMQQIRVKEGAPSAPPQPQTPRGERTLADLHQALADLRRGLQAHQNAPPNLPALPNAVQQNDAARMLQPPNQPQPPAPGNMWAAAAVAAFQHYGPQDVRQQLAQARQQVRQHAAEAVQQAAAVQARQNETQAWQPAALARQNAQLYQAPPVHPPNAQNVFPVVQQPPFFFRQAQPFVGYLVGGGNFGAANVYVPNVDQQPQQQPAMVIQQPPQQQGNNNANPPPQVGPVHQIPPPPENPLMNVPPPPPQPNLNVNEELEILEVHLNQIIQDQQQPPAAAAVGLPAAPVVIDLELDDILDLVIEGQGAGHQEQQAAQQQPEQQGNNQ